MINFKLKKIEDVRPSGSGENARMSWFWLTDADLWLSFKGTNIYEYTKEALEYFGDKPSPYNNYPLVRFIEDFTHIFIEINESIPEELYKLTKDLSAFKKDAEKWLDIYETDENEYSDFYFEEYDNLISWTYKRTFDSGHLIGGPHLSFYRNDNKIRIVWDVNHKLDNGVDLWTAKDGFIELDFIDFIEMVKDFGIRFFKEMDKQIELAVQKDWKTVQIDKKRLLEEHKEREEEFKNQLSLLKQEMNNKTDWSLVTDLYSRMKNEIKTKA
ncbi:hypothetical protein GCM10022393_42930 [Aquimarina addita]|uniref:Uncharacterized protein n=1 Tax=Aquimarina addita TaxID=870485 RepID=A0ABP6UVN3_9FLAO